MNRKKNLMDNETDWTLVAYFVASAIMIAVTLCFVTYSEEKTKQEAMKNGYEQVVSDDGDKLWIKLEFNAKRETKYHDE